ncbi:hypothetical protein BGX38DRAFT_1327413 [Terfezia claveryi]|nr:hypothetical protein BGX38DRAFT_1327413 [Terfezia claveryi]
MSSPTQNTASSPLFTLSCSFAGAIAIIAFIKTVYELRSLFFYMMNKELYAIEFSLLIFILYLITTLRANNLGDSAVLVEEVADDQGEMFFNAEVFEEDEFEGVVQDFSKTHPDLFLEHDWDNADHRVPVAVSEPEFVDEDVEMTDAPPLEDLAYSTEEASAETAESASLMSSVTPTQEDVPRRMYYWETHWEQFKKIATVDCPINDKGTGPVPIETGTLSRPVSKYTGIAGMVPMPKPIGWGIMKEVEENKETDDEEEDEPCFI